MLSPGMWMFLDKTVSMQAARLVGQEDGAAVTVLLYLPQDKDPAVVRLGLILEGRALMITETRLSYHCLVALAVEDTPTIPLAVEEAVEQY